MALIEAYFDESGTHVDAPFTFVAGLIAKKSSWLSISNQWQSVLDKFQVESCHATDLNNLQGEFSGWDDSRRRSFVTRFFKVIGGESGMKSIGCGVERGLFDRLSKEYPGVPLSPYTLCAEYCCAYTGGMAMKKKHWAPVSIVFELRQEHNSPTFEHTRDRLQSPDFRAHFNINSITWTEKKAALPLQFADMFVYELYKLHRARAEHCKSAQIRYPLLQFQELVESAGCLLSEERVREYFEMTQAFVAGNLHGYIQSTTS